MPRSWEIKSPEEAQFYAEQVREEREAADRDSAGLLALQLAEADLEAADRHDAGLLAIQLAERNGFTIHLPVVEPDSTQVIEIDFASRAPDKLQCHLDADSVGFPKEHSLPESWFPGDEVKLHFEQTGDIWNVRRSGTRQNLWLRLWSQNANVIDETVLVTDSNTALPLFPFSELARIELELADNDLSEPSS